MRGSQLAFRTNPRRRLPLRVMTTLNALNVGRPDIANSCAAAFALESIRTFAPFKVRTQNSRPT